MHRIAQQQFASFLSGDIAPMPEPRIRIRIRVRANVNAAVTLCKREPA
jgi:hypothetical protein